jgi:ribonuclease P protein component
VISSPLAGFSYLLDGPHSGGFYLERLKSPQQFSQVYRQGKPNFGRYVVISALPIDAQVSRVGFAVSKKVGKAVVRNKIKRRLRAIFTELAPTVVPGYAFVVGAKRNAPQAEFSQLRGDVYRVMEGSGFLTRTNRCEGEDNA